MSEPPQNCPVAVRHARALHIGVVIVLVVWHVGYDIAILRRGWPVYEPRAAAAGSWVLLAGVQLLGSVLLLRGRLGPAVARTLAAVALAAGAVAVVAYPPGQAIGDVSWAWNTVGWFGVLLLMRQPLWELGALLAANTGITVTVLARDGALDRVTTTRLIVVVSATVGVQLLFALVGSHLGRTAHRVADLTRQRAAHLGRLAADDAVHAARRQRYADLQTRVEPLLCALAGRLDPTDPAVRRTAGIEAARLRRLFAETDDTPHPLWHELRACADIAERRDVDVTFIGYGDPPVPPAHARRLLCEAPLLVLASAATWARVTVVADDAEVVVSVIADVPAEALTGLPGGGDPSVGDDVTVFHDLSVFSHEEGDELWVETRWRYPVPR